MQLPTAVQLPVADVSASGMALRLPRHLLRDLDAGRAQFLLGEGISFEADFAAVSARIEGVNEVRVGTRFRHLSRVALRKLSEFLLTEQMLRSRHAPGRPDATGVALVSEDDVFLDALLRFHGIVGRRPLHAFDGQRFLSRNLTVTSVVGRERIEVTSESPMDEGFRPGRELSFLLSTAGSALWFQAVVRAVTPHRATLTFPTRIVRDGFRDSFRAALDQTDVEVLFKHPRLPIQVRKRALDLSARGLSFPVDVDRDILFPGDRLAPLVVALPLVRFQATAIIRSVRQLASGGLGCGVELLHIDDPAAWAEAVFRSGHPNSLLSEDTAPEGAWRALDTSGYVDLWTHPTARASAKKEFLQAWHAMPKKHGYIIVLKRDQEAVGTIAANRLYRHTWMMHLLGVDKDVRRSNARAHFYGIMRELYTGLVFTLQHLTDLKYLVGFFGSESHWNDTVHVGFERQYPNRAHLARSRYSVFRTTSEQVPRGIPIADISFRVRALEARDLPLVLAGLTQGFTPLECEAYDYQPTSLLDDDFGKECRAAGYERSRRGFVIVNDRAEIQGLLLLETGGEGVNLFNLMNTCRFVPLQPPGPDATQVREVALHHAKRYYERAQKRSHLFFDYGHRRGAAEKLPGYCYLCDGLSWLLHRDALPSWLSYLDDLLGVNAAQHQQSGT